VVWPAVRPLLGALGLALAAAVVVVGPPRRTAAEERVDLIPKDKAGWSPANLFSFLRGGYYSDRTLHVETVPPGAKLDLFYVRASFQKRYEQSVAPVTVELPKRADASNRDSVTIRASLDGYRIETVQVPVQGDQDRVVIEMQPLSNTLVAVSHTYFAGRTALSFLTRVPAQVRVQKSRNGFSVVLAETARDAGVESMVEGIESPLIESIASKQLGEDLLVEVKLAPGVDLTKLDLRSRESQDVARQLSRYTIDIRSGGDDDVARARSALERIGSGDVSGCAQRFDDVLRLQLDREQLSRALTPHGAFTDPYVRAALRRLGEVSPGGVIHMEDGSAFRPGIPLELAAASTQAASAKGLLALIRSWVQDLEPQDYRREALRSLLAPEMDPKNFAAALTTARSAEQSCQGTTARSADGPS
jgi:hypothetical protein